MKVCVMITTYNRKQCVEQLCETLKQMKHDVQIVVIDDASEEAPSTENIDTYIRNNVNGGREGWFDTINKLFRMSLKTEADVYFMLVDDALPNEDFFDEAFRLWNSIEDDKKVALHLANNDRRKNWTNFVRQSYNDELYLTQTTEFSFMCVPTFLKITLKQPSADRWIKRPNAGSGVGEQLNVHHVKKGRRIYGVKKSLIHANNNCTESMMNYEERKLNKWKLL